MRIPPLTIKIMLESNSLKSRILVPSLAVANRAKPGASVILGSAKPAGLAAAAIDLGDGPEASERSCEDRNAC